MTVEVTPESLRLIFQEFPDLTNSKSFKFLLENENIKYIIIALYEEKNGESKRRIGGHCFYKPGDEHRHLKQVAEGLGITIDRTLTEVR